MIEPMSPETIERLMADNRPQAVEQERACELYTRSLLVAQSLVDAYGPDGAELFARQLSRHLARRLELALADDVTGSFMASRSSDRVYRPAGHWGTAPRPTRPARSGALEQAPDAARLVLLDDRSRLG